MYFPPQNMAFQAEQKIKLQIVNSLGTDQIFRLLQDPELKIVMKTLGLLRNLLSTKPHIDHIMGLHGAAIMHVSFGRDPKNKAQKKTISFYSKNIVEFVLNAGDDCSFFKEKKISFWAV